jgi:ElaB/YqjD/DUF883 family membrane-anchored ribosome-binding protein
MSGSDVGGAESGGTGRMEAEARQFGDDLQRSAVQAADVGKTKLSDQLDRGTSEIGSQARSLATVLRRSSAQLATERNGSTEAMRLSKGVAEHLERMGEYLEQRRGSELLDDAEQFARARPWLVAGAAAAAGLMASRLLKASSENRYLRSSREPTWQSPRPQPVSAEREAPLASGV